MRMTVQTPRTAPHPTDTTPSSWQRYYRSPANSILARFGASPATVCGAVSLTVWPVVVGVFASVLPPVATWFAVFPSFFQVREITVPSPRSLLCPTHPEFKFAASPQGDSTPTTVEFSNFKCCLWPVPKSVIVRAASASSNCVCAFQFAPSPEPARQHDEPFR